MKHAQNRQKFRVEARVQKPRAVIDLRKMNRRATKKRLAKMKSGNK